MAHQNGNLQNSYGAEAVPAEAGGLEVVQQQPQKYYEHYAPGNQPAEYPQGGHTPDHSSQGGYTQDYNNHQQQQPGQWQPPPSVIPPESEKKKKKRILGLPVAVFWVIVGGVILVVLGVALGAGLGVGLQNNNSTQSAPAASGTGASTADAQTTTPAPTTSSSSTSSSSSSTTSSLVPVKTGTTGIADNSCQSTTPSTYHTEDGTKFTAYCFTDWPDGDAAADGGKDKVKDIGKTLVYTFEDCMQSCLTFNSKRSGSQAKCAAVTYNSNITSIYAHSRASCFLKDRMGKNMPGAAESASAVIAL